VHWLTIVSAINRAFSWSVLPPKLLLAALMAAAKIASRAMTNRMGAMAMPDAAEVLISNSKR